MTDVLKLAGSVLLLIFVVFFPNAAREAVLGAMSAWAFSFVPALLPVFIVTPALMSERARYVYSRVFGKFSHKLFGIPGPAFAAVTVGLMAGSPSGCSCLAGTSCKKNELCRAGIMASGLSPAFLAVVAGGLLNSPSAGLKLALSQLMAILSAGWLLRGAWADDDGIVCGAQKPQTLVGGMGAAAVDIAGVLCWMALFSLITAVIGLLSVDAANAAAPLLEIATGLARLARSSLPFMTKAMLAAFVCGLGGACVALQNLAKLKFVPVKRLALGKLLHATLTALYFQALFTLPGFNGVSIGFAPWPIMILVVAVYALGRLTNIKRQPPTRAAARHGAEAKPFNTYGPAPAGEKT